jgi:hypothetical protein
MEKKLDFLLKRTQLILNGVIAELQSFASLQVHSLPKKNAKPILKEELKKSLCLHQLKTIHQPSSLVLITNLTKHPKILFLMLHAQQTA